MKNYALFDICIFDIFHFFSEFILHYNYVFLTISKLLTWIMQQLTKITSHFFDNREICRGLKNYTQQYILKAFFQYCLIYSGIQSRWHLCCHHLLWLSISKWIYYRIGYFLIIYKVRKSISYHRYVRKPVRHRFDLKYRTVHLSKSHEMYMCCLIISDISLNSLWHLRW